MSLRLKLTATGLAAAALSLFAAGTAGAQGWGDGRYRHHEERYEERWRERREFVPYYVPAPGPQWVTCAGENGFCNSPPGAVVRFGARGSFVTRRAGGNGIPCSTRVFGDPAYGVRKSCAFLAR
jgi:hypothetical protein